MTDTDSPDAMGSGLRAAVARAEGEFGATAPQTLTAMSELASHLRQRGHLVEAEHWMRQALRARTETLGEEHPDSLLSMNNLAGLLRVQGRFGEAEELLVAVLAARRRAAGDVRVELLTAENNLASLWWDQGRYADAEPLLQQVLEKRTSLLGKSDPATIRAMNNLGSVYRLLGRIEDSERLLREAVALRSDVLGQDHKDTLSSKANLALLLSDKEEFAEAEAILLDAFTKRKDLDGANHPETLLVHNNIGALFRREGRYQDAERELSKVIEASAPLGRSHPLRRLAQLDLAMTLAAQARRDECTALLRAIEPEFLNWVETEYYTNASYAARRQMIASQATFQNLALSLAQIKASGSAAASVAASAVLHFKGLSFDEEAFIARVSRNSSDPEVRALASDIASLRSRLSRLIGVEDVGAALAEMSKELDSKEHRLALRSRLYTESLQARKCSVEQVRAALPHGTAILEFRQYRPVDLRSGKTAEARWAGIWLDRSETVRVMDLGAVSRTTALIDKLLKGPPAEQIRRIEGDLSSQLLKPFADLIRRIERLYIAPDGALYLVPFGTLPTADGPRLVEVAELRLIQAGRDLVARRSPGQNGGLVAMGGIDFDHVDRFAGAGPGQGRAGGGARRVDAVGNDADEQARYALVEALRANNARIFEGGFRALIHSATEVERIGARYHSARPDEPVPEVVLGPAATKERLLGLKEPPRVLHLATHGFYHEAQYSADRPLLAAGIALAGANLALHDRGCDGLLFAIEACDLNLEGTELVVLSACETARGRIDYGEGISGLVRALRLAGARNVIAALRPVSDNAAAEFMNVFYRFLLARRTKSPGDAFRRTQKYYLRRSSRHEDDGYWNSFILFGPD